MINYEISIRGKENLQAACCKAVINKSIYYAAEKHISRNLGNKQNLLKKSEATGMRK